MPAIKGDMYINTHCNYSQPTLIKLDNENIGGHLTPLQSATRCLPAAMVIFLRVSVLVVHISQKLLKIEAYKQRREKSIISPLSNCRMCLDPSVTGFYR